LRKLALVIGVHRVVLRVPIRQKPRLSNVNGGPHTAQFSERVWSRTPRSSHIKTDHDSHGSSFVDHDIQSGRGINDLLDLRADFQISEKAKGKRDKPKRSCHPGPIKAYVPGEVRWNKIRAEVPIL
jgi:hypothetical protein